MFQFLLTLNSRPIQINAKKTKYIYTLYDADFTKFGSIIVAQRELKYLAFRCESFVLDDKSYDEEM